MLRAALALAAAGLLGCLPLPVQVAPAARGVVVDAETGRAVSGSLVLIRYEARYDVVLPERDELGRREAATGPDGRFREPGLVRAGFQAWPWLATEARVISVLHEGYRCPPPVLLSAGEELRIELEPAATPGERRRSCAEVPERWEVSRASPRLRQALAAMDLPGAPAPDPSGDDERTLAARAALGFGANCRGPIVDLALAPDGARAAFAARRGAGIDVYVKGLRGARVGPPERIARSVDPGGRELVWTTRAELGLLAVDASGTQRSLDLLWSPPTPPAARARGGARTPTPATAIDPDDRNDEGDARWMGRAFSLARDLAPETGLPRDLLRVTQPDGSTTTLTLPGEACVVRGRFGRPHYRIAADGRFGLDLRFVHGGCHAVRIDLASGEWSQLDAIEGPAVCREHRRVPPAQLEFAVRDYVRDLEHRLDSASADGSAAYTLLIGSGRSTRIETRTLDGEGRVIAARPFPIATPLRRIEVSIVGPTP
jgi:hypothetical protein